MWLNWEMCIGIENGGREKIYRGNVVFEENKLVVEGMIVRFYYILKYNNW